MKRIISVVIDSPDIFFAEGMRQAIAEYFNVRVVQVHSLHSATSPVDLAFISAGKGMVNRLCQVSTPEDRLSTLYFSVRSKPDVRLRTLPRCKHEAGLVYQHEPIDLVMQRIEKAMAQPKTRRHLRQNCYWCDKQALTERENEVVRRIGKGQSQASIARRLNLSVKTISTHKRSVMRKMQLRGNAELLHWLSRDL
ncbi:response regulator transcription factor [Serratia sp. NPDC078593]|uniref:response regulator transcription factor n=1 Tax=unclassified Serratia (in: enterobacteria) TaxID=2647522 RepID=UPI0037D7E015